MTALCTVNISHPSHLQHSASPCKLVSLLLLSLRSPTLSHVSSIFWSSYFFRLHLLGILDIAIKNDSFSRWDKTLLHSLTPSWSLPVIALSFILNYFPLPNQLHQAIALSATFVRTFLSIFLLSLYLTSGMAISYVNSGSGRSLSWPANWALNNFSRPFQCKSGNGRNTRLVRGIQ